MKSIIFDLSVNRQHGEPVQGPRAADMFLSAPNFHIVFESIEICRCDITGCCFILLVFVLLFFLSLLAVGSRDAHPQFINIGMSIAFYILKTGSLTGS